MAVIDKFSKVRNSLRVFGRIKAVAADALQRELEEAEKDLSALQTIKTFNPNYTLYGRTIDQQISAALGRIQELREKAR